MVEFSGETSGALTFERKGDVTIVKLGTSECYEIPDVLFAGG